VLILAASSAPIPPLPVHFKIEDRDRLFYASSGERSVTIPGFTPRGIEMLMRGFSPLRAFQLRNGVQEFLFRCDAEPPREEPPAPPVSGYQPPLLGRSADTPPEKPRNPDRGRQHRGPRRYGWRG